MEGRKPKFKYYLLISIAMVALLVNCNACVEVGKGNVRYGFERYTNYYSKPEKAEKALTEHIVKRTVLVGTRCKVINSTTNSLVMPYKDAGWGTGVIITSQAKYSLVQTARHVVLDNEQTAGDLKRICDKFSIERRSSNNVVISTYRGRIDVVASDKESDLAVLKVYTNFGVSSAIARTSYLGQNIRVIGYPYLRAIDGKHLSYERGYIATVNMRGRKSFQIRIGAAGYFGNSGGAVWNQQGEVVGTISAITGYRSLGGFIPQQNCLYGPGTSALIEFYTKNRLLSYLLRDPK